METKNITTKFKKFTPTPCFSSDPCYQWFEKFEERKKKVKEVVNRPINMKDSEFAFVKEFLELNNLSLFKMSILLAYRDGALSDQVLTAFNKSYKRAKLDYLNKKEFDFSYKRKYADKDFEELFKNEKTKNRWINMYYVFDELIKEHYIKKGFASFTHYMKALMYDLGIYPENAYQAILPYIKTTLIIDPDEKILERRRKQREKRGNRKRGKIGNDDDKYLKRMTFNPYKNEYEHIVKPFLDFLEEHGLSFKKLVIYELWQNGLIKLKGSGLTKEDIKKIENLPAYDHGRPFPYEQYQRFNQEERFKVKNIVFFINKIFEDDLKPLNGSFGTWVREFILNKYGVYPKFSENEDVYKIYKNENKLRILKEKLEEDN